LRGRLFHGTESISSASAFTSEAGLASRTVRPSSAKSSVNAAFADADLDVWISAMSKKTCEPSVNSSRARRAADRYVSVDV
jgi:hypothetical protein